MLDSQGIENNNSNSSTERPIPINLGASLSEYSQELNKLWLEFEKIRGNGFYAMDENRDVPRFSPNIIFHGLSGIDDIQDTGESEFVPLLGNRTKTIRKFTPPRLDQVINICNTGILSSDIKLETNEVEATEEETIGCADFWTQNREYSSCSEFFNSLPKGNYGYYVLDPLNNEASATLMFAFDKSRPELTPLIEKEMIDSQSSDSLWPNKIKPKTIDFPGNSGLHLAIPVGLPSNYIEYIVVDDNSAHWQNEKLEELKAKATVDGHVIPLVSIHTNQVI